MEPFQMHLESTQICGELILSYCLKREGRKCTRVLTTFKGNISKSILSCNLEMLKRVLNFPSDSLNSLMQGMNSLYNWNCFTHCITGYFCGSINLRIFLNWPGIFFALEYCNTALKMIWRIEGHHTNFVIWWGYKDFESWALVVSSAVGWGLPSFPPIPDQHSELLHSVAM